MARVKLTEFATKTLLHKEGVIANPQVFAASVHTTTAELQSFFKDTPLVAKVDQGIKKRGKLGLVKINATTQDVIDFIGEKNTYQNFMVEPMLPHDANDEHYLSLERTREGFLLLYSPQGGVDVESAWNNVQKYELPKDTSSLPKLIAGIAQELVLFCNKYDIAFLEVNPLVATPSGLKFLDAAALYDDVSQISLSQSTLARGLVPEPHETQQEETVARLNANTPASLKLKVLNKNGSIWMLLSGGGASIVLADELADLGHATEIGNYGEYSGSPTTEDVYEYTKCILSLMLASSAHKKVLVIAGGVANFTDVAKTFKGIITAMAENLSAMQKQNIKVYVRRGGPNQTAGLAQMQEFLAKNNILGSVADSSVDLSDVVSSAVAEI